MKIGKINLKKIKYPLIIPEMGINHSGNFDVAIKIIKSAHRAGAKIIKNQTHIVEDEYSEEGKKIKPDNSKKFIYDLIKACQLSFEEEAKLKEFTEKLGMEYLSTPFSKAAVDRLIKLKVKAIKIGSGEFNNYPLLEYICKFKKPLILSTGMNLMPQILKTVKILKKNKIEFALNHCTNIYPTKYSEARINFITKLKKKFPNVPIGISDHSKDNLVAISAIPLGVQLIERHFVDTKKRKGPDISSSMDFDDLKDLINKSKNIKEILGEKKEILNKEKNVAKFAFASVVSIKNIRRGEKFTKNNIWIKRPGTGDFNPSDYKNLIGKKSKKNIYKNFQIKKSDL